MSGGFRLHPQWLPDPAGGGNVDPTLGGPVALDAGDGRRFIAERRRGETRWSVCVIETKVPYEQRVTRELFTDPDPAGGADADGADGAGGEPVPGSAADRHYRAVDQAADAPDDHPLYGVGVESWWFAYFTEAEVEQLRAADNTIHVTYQTRFEAI